MTRLCQSSYTPYQAQETRRLTVQTVVLMECVLPKSEHCILWHLLIHLADDVIDKGPILYYWMFRHERYWGLLTNCLRRRTDPEICIAMIMTRRLRPPVMRDIAIEPLTKMAEGSVEGNAKNAKSLLTSMGALEDGQGGWMGARAGHSAAVRPRTMICTLRGRGVTRTLGDVERKLLHSTMHISFDFMDSTPAKIFDTANLLGSTFSTITAVGGREHPLRSFVEIRDRTDRGVYHWWGLVIKFASVGGTDVAFLRVFESLTLRTSMARDVNLGTDFTLNALAIGDGSFNFAVGSNWTPNKLVPITRIWSNCIVVPWPIKITHRTETGATHIVLPVRRQLST